MAMWRPPERIRYEPASGPWPSAQRAARSRLFSPIQLGPLNLQQRTWVPAMVPWRATDDGFVSPNVLAWYERFARGRPGAIVIEATGIRDVPSGPLLRLGDDRFLPGIRELVEVVRRASGGQTRLLIQLIDFLAMRRRPERAKYLERLLRITDAHREALGMAGAPEAEVRTRLAAADDETLRTVLAPRELEALEHGYRERVTDMELEHIARLPETLPKLFADAAVRAEQAGLDGVELHYAHAYTMASFLSATNERQDGYGGSRVARVRLPLEVFGAVRAAVSKDFAVGCRFLAQECIEGGSSIDDAVWYATEFARAGMDFISVSRGGKFDDAKQPKVGEAAYPYTGPSGYECMPSYYSDAVGPFGRNLPPSKLIRAAIRAAGFMTPLVTAGGIHNFQQAEDVLASEQADVVGFARQALADPDWFAKVRSGRGAEVRLCLYTNYCEALDQRHREVTCELWDREGLDQPDVARTADGKRRLLAPDW
ncbi:MAG: NADH:flavin oxidoreductase [Pseudomonadota bacterium]|nr:NADH:flavin oxidoreductase [Pseudomonadota bacterium]